jgi:hypothetical protein
MYDERTIKWYESKGFADAAENVRLAERISALSNDSRFEEAEALLDDLTIPSLRENIEHEILFDKTCRCIQPPA